MEPCPDEEAAACGSLICRQKTASNSGAGSKRMAGAIAKTLAGDGSSSGSYSGSSGSDRVDGSGTTKAFPRGTTKAFPRAGNTADGGNDDDDDADESVLDERFHAAMSARFGADKWSRVLRTTAAFDEEDAPAFRQGTSARRRGTKHNQIYS